jgi:hypothetical protein
MEQKYYCKKRCIILDKDFETCDTCFKNTQSGFTDLDMCKQFNITYKIEDLENDYNSI